MVYLARPHVTNLSLRVNRPLRKVAQLITGLDPTITSYSNRVAKIYNATSSLVPCLKTEIFSSTLKNDLVVNKVIGLAPGLHV
jgi:hypothetical protein